MTILKSILAAGALIAAAMMPVAGQTATSRAARADGGKPDLNGIWQTSTKPTTILKVTWRGPRWRSGPAPMVRCRPRPCWRWERSAQCLPSLGVVEGGEIPYKPEALATEEREPGELADRDPEIKCYLPGVPRATYMPQPFRIFQNATQIFIAYQYAGAVRNIYLKDPGAGSGRFLDGPIRRPLGGRHAGGRRDRFERLRPGLIAREIITATRCT